MNELEIYLSYYKDYFVPKNELFFPIQVGAENSSIDLNFLKDSIGNHISEKNETFNELTAVYWIWKNTKQNYVGLFHYRRYLVYLENLERNKNYFYKILNKITKKSILNSEEKINKILNSSITNINKDLKKYDLFLPKIAFLPYTLKEHYYKSHISAHYDLMEDEIIKQFPYLKNCVYNTSNSNGLILGNMFIMKRDIFEDYCEKMFSVLNEVERKIILPTDDYQKRAIGFLAERFTTIYMNYLTENGNYKIKYLDILNTDSTFGIHQSFILKKKLQKIENKKIFGDFQLMEFDKNRFLIEGWAILEDTVSQYTKKYIELKKIDDEETIFLKTEDTFKNEITKYFSDTNGKYINYDSSGFNTFVSLNELKFGSYKITIYLENIINNKIFKLTFEDKILEISKNGIKTFF